MYALDQIHGAASIVGVDPDAAVKTVKALQAEGFRGRRLSRRRKIEVGLTANGISLAVWRLWWVAKWFLPLQVQLIVAAVEWAVDYLEST